MNAAVMALFNIRRAFGVTPKGVLGGRLAIRYVIPHLVLMILSIAAVFAGVYKLTQVLDFAVLVNAVWAAYHAVLLGMVFYFNRYFETHISRPVFTEESVS